MVNPNRREVFPLLRIMRDYLLGRTVKQYLRFADDMSPRPGPPPILPENSFLTISANQYHKRDVRRQIAPPIDLTKDQKLIAESSADTAKPPPVKYGAPLPGRRFEWIET